MANPNAFANSPLDRVGHRRSDQAWLEAALVSDNARLMPMHAQRPFVTEEGGKLGAGWLSGHVRARIAPPEATLLFLGVDNEGAPHFALDLPDAAPLEGVGRFDDLRAVAPHLAWDDLAILGCAKSIFEWHARNGFCANCGAPTAIAEAGWKRVCLSCKAEHFPRVDPVAIMLPVIGEKCLLGRQRGWPRGMHSALAGFIEPGETIEAGVARETLEEAGLRVVAVRLHSNQPWPFPHSLMLGAICDVADDSETVDAKELESARWFTRDEVRAMLAGEHPDAWCPPKFAIAHQLMKSWAEEG